MKCSVCSRENPDGSAFCEECGTRPERRCPSCGTRCAPREQSELVENVGLRVAVNTGEVVVSDEHAAGIGDPLNVAARLQQEGSW